MIAKTASHTAILAATIKLMYTEARQTTFARG